ncbi:MAG: SPFH domain-containing protein [Lentisphaeria bacterium]
MISDRRQERIAFAGCVQLIFAATLYVLGQEHRLAIGSYFVIQLANILLVGGLAAGLAAFHAWMARLAVEEEGGESARDTNHVLFDNETDAMGDRQRARRQFERTMLPVLVIGLSLLEGVLAVWVIRSQMSLAITESSNDLAPLLTVASLLVAAGIVSFIYGKYCAAVAYGESAVFLRPVCGFALWSAIVCFIGAVTALLRYWGHSGVGIAITWTCAVAAVFLALERLLLWIVEHYRPHTGRLPERTIYESRLLAVFSHPRGVMGNLADIIDYQFGLKISEQWLSRFAFRVVLPYLLFQFATILLLSCLVYVAPHETGLAERPGVADYERLDPGLHVRLPWPLSRVTRVGESRVATVALAPPPTPPKSGETASDLALWSDVRFADGLYVTAVDRGDVAGDDMVSANLAAAAISVRYGIADARLYLSRTVDPARLMEVFARRALVHYLSTHDFDTMLSAGRTRISSDLMLALGPQLEPYGLRVLNLEVTAFQPPPAAAPVFREVIDARMASAAALIDAATYAERTAAGAEQAYEQHKAAAEAEAAEIVSAAKVANDVYKTQYKHYVEYPRLYRTRARLDAVVGWLQDVRKIVITADCDREQVLLQLRDGESGLLEALEGN